jgi:hypothetical protein
MAAVELRRRADAEHSDGAIRTRHMADQCDKYADELSKGMANTG